MNKEIFYIWLNTLNGIGPVLGNRMINHFSSIENVYSANKEKLLEVEGVGEKIACVMLNNKSLDRAIELHKYCKKNNINITTREDKNYPEVLKAFCEAPNILYYIGDIERLRNPIAIVGSRRCNERGKEIAVDLADELAKRNKQIISGMAKGIDGYAQTISVNNNNYTIAILGTGVDICYPKEHLKLRDRIIENGVVISQFLPKTTNMKSNFIKRNELIAMLCEELVLVQGTERSGAIYTAKNAMEYKKKVFSVPGDICDKLHKGNNKLIEEGAEIYLGLESLGINRISRKEIAREKLDDIELSILKALNEKPKSIEELEMILKIDINKIEEKIFNLELCGYVKYKASKWTNN